jgi:hypothetical protein
MKTNFLGGALTSLLLVLSTFSIAKADDIDGTDSPKVYRTHFYVGFANRETTAAEIVWQLLNVVDTMQTLQIAKNGACFEEIGQLSMISNHPTTRQVYIGMSLFAAGHYLVSKGIDSLVVENPDYMVVQRVWQYSALSYKIYTVENNARIGIDLDHSRSCVQ